LQYVLIYNIEIDRVFLVSRLCVDDYFEVPFMLLYSEVDPILGLVNGWRKFLLIIILSVFLYMNVPIWRTSTFSKL